MIQTLKQKYNDVKYLYQNVAKLKNVAEQGVTGTQIYSGYISDEDYNTDWDDTSTKFDRIEQMVTDAQINAVLLAHKLPLLQATLKIEPASDDNIDKQIAEEVENCLFNNPTFQWSVIYEHILKFFENGFYLFEKVPFYDKETNKYQFKLAPRKSRTIEEWHQDKNGNLDRVMQFAQKPDGNFESIFIPNDKLVLFNVGQEGNNWPGKSMLRVVWRNYYLKDQLMKLDAIKHDRHAIPVPIIHLPENEKSDDFDKAKEVGESYRAHHKGYLICPHGWDVKFPDVSKSSGTDIAMSIMQHNKEITGAYMTNFLLVGMTESGTYNMLESKQDMFLYSMQAFGNKIEDVINEVNEGRGVIKHWVYWNYGDKYQCPKFRISKIANIDFEKLAETLFKLSNGGFLLPTDSIQEYLIQELDLPESGTIITTPQTKPDIITKKENEQIENVSCGHQIELKSTAEEFIYRRKLTDLEQNVLNLNDIKDKLNVHKESMKVINDQYRKLMINRLVDNGTKLLTKKQSLDQFKNDINDYVNKTLTGDQLFNKSMTQAIKVVLKDVYKYGQYTVREELTKQKVKLSAENVIVEEGTKVIKPIAELTSQALINKLTFEFKKELTKQKSLDMVNTNRLRQILTALSSRDFNTEAIENIMTIFGQSRAKEAFKVKDDIKKVVRSEIFDSATCKPCMAIDNKEFSIDDPFYDQVAGGPYIDCEGGNKCRGINIYVSGD